MDKTIEALKAKWSEYKGFYEHDQTWAPGKFCVLLSDEGGQMPCVTSIRARSYFESKNDFLGWLAWCEIPRIFTWHEDEPDISPDAYLSEFDEDFRTEVLACIETIECAIEDPAYDLEEVLEEFNCTFSDTNPQVQILAYGNDLSSFLKSLIDWFDADLDEDDENDEETLAAIEDVRSKLEKGKFDENNSAQRKAGLEFIELFEAY